MVGLCVASLKIQGGMVAEKVNEPREKKAPGHYCNANKNKLSQEGLILPNRLQVLRSPLRQGGHVKLIQD